VTNLLYSSCIVASARKRIEIAAAAPIRGLAEETASVAKYTERISWHDRITSLRTHVRSVIGRPSSSPIITRCYWQQPPQFRFDRPTASITLAAFQLWRGEEGEQSRCVPALRSGRSPCRRVESFRLGLDARLTPLLQIDGYLTSTVPGCADRSVLTDSI